MNDDLEKANIVSVLAKYSWNVFAGTLKEYYQPITITEDMGSGLALSRRYGVRSCIIIFKTPVCYFARPDPVLLYSNNGKYYSIIRTPFNPEDLACKEIVFGQNTHGVRSYAWGQVLHYHIQNACVLFCKT